MYEKKKRKYTILFYLFIYRVAKFFQIRHYIKGHKKTDIIKVYITYFNQKMLPSFPSSYFVLHTMSSPQIPKSFFGPKKTEQKCHSLIKAPSSLGFLVYHEKLSIILSQRLTPRSELRVTRKGDCAWVYVCMCLCNSPYFTETISVSFAGSSLSPKYLNVGVLQGSTIYLFFSKLTP